MRECFFMGEKQKEKNQVRIGKGLFFSIVYTCVTIIICLISGLLKESIIKIITDWGWISGIDKITVLGINSAISVCVVTTLTLALSIEGNARSFKFGLSPKRLNEYLNYPISLPCSFIALGVQFVASLAMIRAGNAPLFYAFTFTSLFYFIVLIIKGLPVLSGNHKLTYERILKAIATGSEKEINDGFAILKYLYSTGDTFDDIYCSLSKGKKIDDPVGIKKILVRALYSSIEESEDSTSYIPKQWTNLAIFIKEIATNKMHENCLECKEEWFHCIYSFYSKPGYSKKVIDLLCDVVYGYRADLTKNDNNISFIEYIFIQFISILLQNGDFDSIDTIKRMICKQTDGTFKNKKQRLYFFTISFLLYSYCFDKKVPDEFKNEIASLKNSSGEENRFENQSWSVIFNKMVLYNFDIDKDEFITLIEEYGGYAEFYTTIDPSLVITREKALIWYWTHLLISNECDDFSKFIGKSDSEDLFYLKKFFKNIKTGEIDEPKRMANFFFQFDEVELFLKFGEQLEEELFSHISSEDQKVLNQYIHENDIDKNNLIAECIKQITNDLSSIQINGNSAKSRHYSQTFLQRYKRDFSKKANLEAISHNVVQRIQRTIHCFMNPILLKKTTPTFEADFLTECKRKRVLFANKKFESYFNNGFLPQSWSSYAKKASKVDFSLHNNPFYFVSRLPYIGNISVDIKIVPFSVNEISALKKECDDGTGLFCLENVYYKEKDFQKAVNDCYYNLSITISLDYTFSKSKILEISLF